MNEDGSLTINHEPKEAAPAPASTPESISELAAAPEPTPSAAPISTGVNFEPSQISAFPSAENRYEEPQRFASELAEIDDADNTPQEAIVMSDDAVDTAPTTTSTAMPMGSPFTSRAPIQPRVAQPFASQQPASAQPFGQTAAGFPADKTTPAAQSEVPDFFARAIAEKQAASVKQPKQIDKKHLRVVLAGAAFLFVLGFVGFVLVLALRGGNGGGGGEQNSAGQFETKARQLAYILIEGGDISDQEASSYTLPEGLFAKNAVFYRYEHASDPENKRIDQIIQLNHELADSYAHLEEKSENIEKLIRDNEEALERIKKMPLSANIPTQSAVNQRYLLSEQNYQKTAAYFDERFAEYNTSTDDEYMKPIKAEYANFISQSIQIAEQYSQAHCLGEYGGVLPSCALASDENFKQRQNAAYESSYKLSSLIYKHNGGVVERAAWILEEIEMDSRKKEEEK